MNGIPLMKLAPAVALVLSCIFALYIGGPGAIAFPITALLWCALSYSLFTTAVLAFLFSTWTLSAIKLGLLSGWPDLDAQYALISIRLGVTLMSLAPIAVGSVVVARNELLERLEHLACHDGLTGLLNRRAFTERSEGRLAAAAQTAQVSTALMMDIDHFKRINDTYGHAAGDTVLKSFATVAQSCLREEDMIGRLGGEEFAALFVNCAPGEAAAVAERIRAAIADTVIPIDDGRTVPMTVSIGMAETKEISTSIEALLSAADKALYAAKTSGRNRVSVAA
jgi:diguanylate cyclase (GGDEF)-like protein